MTAPQPLRIAVADDDEATRTFFERFLPLLGHRVSSVAADGRQLVEQCRANPPDLVIADVVMPEMSGLKALELIQRERPVPAVLVTGHSEPELVEGARAVGVLAYLVKPVTEQQLAPAIALARSQFEQLQKARREAADLRQALEERKLVERAKGSVTRRLGVPEGDAYRKMQKYASDRNLKLAEVAGQVLKAEEVFQALEKS